MFSIKNALKKIRVPDIPAMNLRNRCLMVAYISYFCSSLTCGWYVFVIGIITKGFICEPSIDISDRHLIEALDKWIGRIVKLASVGTHGFLFNNPYVELNTYESNDGQECHDGYFHLSIISCCCFVTLLLWQRVTNAFCCYVRDKNARLINMFFYLSIVKASFEILLLFIRTDSFTHEYQYYEMSFESKMLQCLDFSATLYVLCTIKQYHWALVAKTQDETREMNREQPIIDFGFPPAHLLRENKNLPHYFMGNACRKNLKVTKFDQDNYKLKFTLNVQ